MRLVLGLVLLVHAGSSLWSHLGIQTTVNPVLLTGSGLLLIAGLWTPLAGTVVAVIEISQILASDRDLLVCLLTGTLGVALAMLGPGRWSVDARLFGWKRVEAAPRTRSPNAL